jgi:hypothetical protein
MNTNTNLASIVANLGDYDRDDFLRGLRKMQLIYCIEDRDTREVEVAKFRGDRDAWKAVCEIIGPMTYRGIRAEMAA